VDDKEKKRQEKQQRFMRRVQRKLRSLRKTTHPGLDERKFGEGAGMGKSSPGVVEGKVGEKELKRQAAPNPGILLLAGYVEFCGSTLGKFFSELEATDYSGKPNPPHLDLHDRLQAILDCGPEAERRIRERIEDVEVWLESSRDGPRPRVG
jgi:hypothetical protein